MKVILVGNYAPDAQQSMLRFGAMLERSWRERGVKVTMAQPRAVLGSLARRATGIGKWCGYVDKYLLFPRTLRRTTRAADLVHVLDHSNALYTPRRAGVPWVVTCHDLLAVRGALGEDTDCPASALGRRLQWRIRAGLGRAAAVACDSSSTRADLERLVPQADRQLRRVILMGQNRAWRRVNGTEARARLAALPGVPWDEPYLLHVGSNLRRKNKAGVVRVLGRLRERWRGNVVLCGGELTPDLQAQVRASGVAGRVFGVTAPDDGQLEAAYSLAHALLYPSKCEGFGWPVIEAQACGCPVIGSNRTSLPEVAGEGGLLFELDDEAGMAEAVLRLLAPEFRAHEVARGRANEQRFTVGRMVDEYARLYQDVRAQAPQRTGNATG